MSGKRYEVSKEPKKKPFESKKKFEARKRAEEVVDGYVQQGLKRVKAPRQVYQVTCGHCKGYKTMSNGKPCFNCGGFGKILRG